MDCETSELLCQKIENAEFYVTTAFKLFWRP